MPSEICGKCGGAMEKGFMIEAVHHAVTPPQWAEGDIKRSIWTGVDLKGKTRYTVTTYRCTKCGFLESYTE